jgi:hypothetical protein
MRDNLDPIIDKVDLLLAELRVLRSIGPHFKIVHHFREPGSLCAPGEEIAAAYLMHHSHDFSIPLSGTLLIVFDFLAKHSRVTQGASQIVASVHADPFYRKHGANALTLAKLTRKINRSGVKEFMKRIRRALEQTFREAGLYLDPRAVLVSQATVTNQVGYKLRATFDWAHIDRPDYRPSISCTRQHRLNTTQLVVARREADFQPGQ